MTTKTGPPFVGQDWDDDLETRDDVAQVIARGIARAEVWLLTASHSVVLNDARIAALHRMAFSNVFPDFAGRFRGPSPNYIAYNVTFGNRRGIPHDEVPQAMETLGRDAASLIQQLDQLQTDMAPNEFRHEVLKAAAYVHCRFVEIHPFVNGNGRTSRLCINYFLRRYGLPIIAIERPDVPEYIDAIRSWLDHRTVDHFSRFLHDQIQSS